MGELVIVSTKDEAWGADALSALDRDGAVLVDDILEADQITGLCEACDVALARIGEAVGSSRLESAGELGVARFPMLFDDRFLELFTLDPVLEVVDHTTGPASICHVMNAFALPSRPESETGSVFQNSMHMDFPRRLNGYLASVNTFFPLSAFSRETGATQVLLGSHRLEVRPSDEQFRAEATTVECAPGGMLVFNSNTWHAAGRNESGRPRYAVNIQWTRAFFKQQVDYVRALGDQFVLRQPPRTQQILGWYTRLPTSLDEYYRAPEDRLYRSGQG